MKTTRRIVALVAAITVLPLSAFAQDSEADEEIVVVSKKSIAKLRKEVYQAEEEFYEIYNTLNDDPDYVVRCQYETVTGTRVKNHVCRAKFVSDSFARHASRNRNDMARVANQDADPTMVAKSAIFEEKLATLVNSNPELAAAFQRYNDARVQFFAARDSR